MLRHIAWTAVACVGFTSVLGGEPNSAARSQPAPSKPDRSYGTALQWEPNLEAAAKAANRSRKLLMVLAVAGHFEDPFFT